MLITQELCLKMSVLSNTEDNEKNVLKHYLSLSSSSSLKLGNGKLWLKRPPLKVVH